MFFVLSIGCTWILLVGVGAVDDPKRIIKKLFLLSRFSLTKRMVQGGEATSERRRRDGVSGKSHQRELSPLSRRRQPTHCVHWSIPLSLKSLPCRLAATGANKVPRPSCHSLTTATGSKRSSADSDLLLCHIRLWRTSRFRFGCASVCEHSEIGFTLIVPSTHILDSRPPMHFQRACR